MQHGDFEAQVFVFASDDIQFCQTGLHESDIV